MDLDHFFKRHSTKDGLTNECKECLGKKFTRNLIVKEGYKFCKKCDRELLAINKFFPEDKLCKDGLRNVCRECGQDGHFMEDNYIPKRWWTKEEDDFFIAVYNNYTNEELIKIYYHDCTSKDLSDKAFRLGILGKTDEVKIRANIQRSKKTSGEKSYMYGKPMSDDRKKKLSIAKKGKYIGINNKLFGIPHTEEHKKNSGIARKKLGRWKGNNNPRHNNPLVGSENGRWKGGIKPENQRIRSSEEYKIWRNAVFVRDNFTCQCCGDDSGGNLESHHIENFSTNEELRFDIENGITLCNKCHNPNIHNSFHNLYGTFNNTKNQLDEYIKRFIVGEFKEVS